MFMDLDTKAVFAPLTKWNAVVHDPRRLPELVRRAFREALSGRPGPVHLDIPQDVLAATTDYPDDEFALPPERYRATLGPRPAAESVARAAALLRAARRPLVVAGGGVVTSGAVDAVRTLAGLLGAPVVPTQMALGVVASDSPHFIGHGGLIARRRAARGLRAGRRGAGRRLPLLVLDVGCPRAFRAPPPPHHQHQHRPVRAGPSGARTKWRCRPMRGWRCKTCWPPSRPRRRSERRASAGCAGLREVRARLRRRALAAMARDPDPTMHPAALAKAIADALPGDALAVFDGGHTTFWSNDFTPVDAVRTRFHEPGMSHLGFGLPYALSLQLQHPDRPVFNITGDGSFGFTLNELDTARRAGLPVVCIIHNNAVLGHHPFGPAGTARFRGGDQPRRHRLCGDRARLRLLRRNRDPCGAVRAGPGPGAGLGPAVGAGLPHAFRVASRRAGLRQHEPLSASRRSCRCHPG